MEEMDIKEICKAVQGKLEYNYPEEIWIKNISIDTRIKTENGLFIAIEGCENDGHNYTKNSYEKGYDCLIVSKEVIKNEKQVIIKVVDTKKAIMDLAKYYKSKFDLVTIGITGSSGKTTTKDIVASVLSEKYKVLKTEGNFNNELGVPLTIFNIEKKHQVAVIEMGMNHFGEIHNLTMIAKPDISIITNIGKAHIENLINEKGILEAKLEIANAMDNGKLLFLNGDDAFLKNVNVKRLQTVKYGYNKNNDIKVSKVVNKNLNGFELVAGGIDVSIHIPGEFMVYNCLVGICCGKELGLTEDEIKKGIRNFKLSKNRLEIIKSKKGVNIINDVYNANPDSMKKAIKMLNDLDLENKVLIAGDMFELGNDSYTYHKEIGEVAFKSNINIIVFIGENSEQSYKQAKKINNINKKIKYYKTQREFLDNINEFKFTNRHTILIKGSRGMKLENTVEKIKEI